MCFLTDLRLSYIFTTFSSIQGVLSLPNTRPFSFDNALSPAKKSSVLNYVVSQAGDDSVRLAMFDDMILAFDSTFRPLLVGVSISYSFFTCYFPF